MAAGHAIPATQRVLPMALGENWALRAMLSVICSLASNELGSLGKLAKLDFLPRFFFC
jgi:hypothetical protein